MTDHLWDAVVRFVVSFLERGCNDCRDDGQCFQGCHQGKLVQCNLGSPSFKEDHKHRIEH